MYFFADPLPHYKSFNDLEGLSDWRLAEVPGPKVSRFAQQCLSQQQVCMLSELLAISDNVAWCRTDISTPAGANALFLFLCLTFAAQCSHVDPTLLQVF